jgi:hypothetical protein
MLGNSRITSMSELTKPIFPKTILLFTFILSFKHHSEGQTDSIAFVFQDAIENSVANNDDNAFDYDTQFEHLKDFVRHPLNINKANFEDFENLKLLSSEQIQRIIQYRVKYGLYFTLYELQSILDLDIIHRILPFITVDGDLDDYQLPIKEWFKRGKNDAFIRMERRLEASKGFLKDISEGGFTGDRFKTYMRYRYSFGNRLSYGITLEKDAGEKWRPNLDFTSFHFKIKNPIKGINTLALGDYAISLGQGLIHENGFNLGKSALVLSIEKNEPLVKQYTSSNESNFMRGVALEYKMPQNTEGGLWLSYRKRDANIITPLVTDPSDDSAVVSSLQFVGLHRTRNELEDKNSLSLFTVGNRFLTHIKRGTIALNAVFNHFDKMIDPKPEPYNLHYFRGKSLLNVSTDYKLNYKNVHSFGEFAMSDNLGFALTNGLLVGLDKRFSIAALHRFFSLKYQALNAQPFAESSRVNDENGFYLGMNYAFNKKWALSAYMDVWKYQWLRFRTDAPSQGYELFLKSSFKLKNTEGSLQFRTKLKQESSSRPDSAKVNSMIDKTKTQLRLYFQYKISNDFIVRNRVEFSFFKDDKKSRGFVIWQDVSYTFNLGHSSNSDSRVGYPLSISSRLAFFDTDNYASAIYAYENDLMYNFTVLPYYYRGSRFYFNLSYSPLKNCTTEFRIAQTRLTNQNSFSSGLDEILGNKRTDMKVQVHFTF